MVQTKLTTPKMYTVKFHNDDTTAMDFVTMLLTTVFQYDQQTAQYMMLEVHQQGSAIVGTFPKEVAESRKAKCIENAKLNDFNDFKVTVKPHI